MPIGPPEEPAQGPERVICWFGIVVMIVVTVFNIVLSIASAEMEFGMIHLLLPFVIGFIAVARLKGWVRRGGVS